MKKLITLMAFGMVCASMGATVVEVTDANKKVSGAYTYVAVPNFNNLVLEYRHTFKPKGNFTKAYMAYIDENGNELRSFDIVGAKGMTAPISSPTPIWRALPTATVSLSSMRISRNHLKLRHL